MWLLAIVSNRKKAVLPTLMSVVISPTRVVPVSMSVYEAGRSLDLNDPQHTSHIPTSFGVFRQRPLPWLLDDPSKVGHYGGCV